MNTTNRFLNRALVFVVGLVLLGAGGVVAAGALLPDVQKPVGDAASNAVEPTNDALAAQPWILWVAAVVAVVLILVLVWFIARQGRGRTATLLRADARAAGTPSGGSASAAGRSAAGTGTGTVTVDVKVAEQLLEDALSRNPDIVAVDVTGFTARRGGGGRGGSGGGSVLRVTAHARRGASPTGIRSAIDTTIAEWDAVLGEQVPVVIQIVSGLRTRMTETARVV